MSQDSTVETVITREAEGSRSMCERIDEVCADPDSYEEGEPRPNAKAIDNLKALLDDAASIMGADLNLGDIAPYFGEVSITWKCGEKMLRVAAFSDHRPPRMDFGSTPAGSLGSYEFDTNVTGEKLASKFRWLYSLAAGSTYIIEQY